MRIKKTHIKEKEFQGIRAEGTSELFLVDYFDENDNHLKRRVMIIRHVDDIDEEIRKIDHPTPEEIEHKRRLFEDTYVEKRAARFSEKSFGDQLDAIIKGFDSLKNSGVFLPQETIDLINWSAAIKQEIRKP